MNTNKELTHKLFLQREQLYKHNSYETEMNFYNEVASGIMPKMKRSKDIYLSSGYGILSDDTIRNMRYHIIISIALITRFCVESGMEMETAYSLSDLYIQRVDKCNTIDELDNIHYEMVSDFSNRMRKIKRGNIYSKPIVRCLDYIYDNLQNKLSLEELADYVSLSPQYLSKLFHKEVGIPFKEYIIRKRIEAAENMLKYSDFSIIDISNYLAFSSHSHFIQTFKKYTGFTPKEYQNEFFRSNKLSDKINNIT